VRECGIDDVGVRKTKDEFSDGNAGEQAGFAKQPVVRRPLKFE
jgi:hypothetical protein